MCGIYGYSGKKRKINLSHRGPDEHGEFKKKNIAMGSYRLSIIDIKKGQQPMEYKGRVVVYNGEIYNYKKLRTNLIKKGYKFKTNCDTEILIPMYLEYGTKMLNKLDGQFAFCIYDKGELFLARDQFGIMPLFYTKESDFMFCSEIKPIVDYKKPLINHLVIPTYLKYRYVPSEYTLYQGIYKLLPGHYMIIRENGYINEPVKYYTLKIKKNDKSFEENKKKIKSLLTGSVNDRLMSEVPIGTFLSGGVDSTIITSLIKDKKPDTFCIGLEYDNEFDEAEKTAKELKLNFHHTQVSSKLFKKLNEKHIFKKAYPYSVPNELLITNLAREVKKIDTVLLSGEGADEIFCGYDILYRKAMEEGYEKAIESYGYFTDNELSMLSPSPVCYNDIKKEGTDLQTFSKFMVTFHLPCLLQRLDFATMQSGVESRPPFVTRKLIEYVISIPDKQKITKKDSKIILKEAFKDIIPKAVYKRKKMGFPIVVDLYDELKELIAEHNGLLLLYPGLKNIHKFKKDKLKIMFLYNLFFWMVEVMKKNEM